MSRFKHIWKHWYTPHNETPPYFGPDLIIVKDFLTTNKYKTMAEQNLAPKLINANLDVIEEEVLSKLPPEINKLAKAASDAIGETGVVLFDGEPANGPQVEKIWREYVNTHLIDFATVKAENEAQKIGSDILRNLSLLLINPASESLKVLTDEVTDDGAQLKAEWINFLLEGNNLSVLLNNTLKPALELVKVLNEAFVTLLVGLAEDQLRKALEKQ